jgi:hypothetical protein
MKQAILYSSFLALAALGLNAPAGQETTINAESGLVAGPFVVTNGHIYQPVPTDLTNGGLAVYTFTITNSGSYAVQALVNAPNSGANSFYVNIDAEPEGPCMIWDIPLTSGFEPRVISWRGNGTTGRNQCDRKVFSLTQGTHHLVLRGREPNAQWKEFTLVRLSAPPSGFRIVSVHRKHECLPH